MQENWKDNNTQLVLLPKLTDDSCDCSKCLHASVCRISDTVPDTYYKYKCNKCGKMRLIYLTDVADGEKSPKWCPMRKKDGQDKSVEAKKAVIKNARGLLKWDDIIAFNRYHIPPMLHYERENITVKYKSVDYLSYTTDKDPKTYRVIYKDDPRVKFISKL